MTQPIIEALNLGKCYFIPPVKSESDNFLDKILAIARFSFSKKQRVWALRNLNIEVERGDVVAILGDNGSGKSTLFRLISEITAPSEGELIIRGSVSSMIEVGVGFHRELTGRENLFLNGALLGMTTGQIENTFNEIVRFSEIGKYLDTPIKKYSNGMHARLAFAVASHLNSDILIVDEVLSVSDQQYRLKAIDRLRKLSAEGVTILIVSHDLALLHELCNSAIYLKNGRIEAQSTFNALYEEFYKPEPKL